MPVENLIEQLLDAQQKQNTLIETVDDAGRRIEVYQDQGMRWIYTGGQSIQSTLDLNEPERLVQAYQQVMLTALLLNPTPHRILNLGFGGGAFERFFNAGKNALEIVSVDANAALVALAQKHMQVPQQWPVVIELAEVFLSGADDLFDILLCDLFVGQHHADCLSTADFYLNASNRLTDAGVMVANLAPRSEAELITILSCARQVFCGAMISQVNHQSNIVLVLSKQPLPTTRALAARNETCQNRWPLDFDQLLAGFKPFPNKICL